MNRQSLLSIYEKLEAIISKLPGPLQNAVSGELRPIKQIFLAQRLARIVLVGKPAADASALFSALVGSNLEMIDVKPAGGWVAYELRGRGGFKVLDARRLNETSLAWSALTAAINEECPDLFVFLVDGSQPLDLAELRHQSKAGLIGVIDFPNATAPDVVEARRLDLQAWLSGPGKLSSH